MIDHDSYCVFIYLILIEHLEVDLFSLFRETRRYIERKLRTERRLGLRTLLERPVADSQ